jgi:hypothetical protein
MRVAIVLGALASACSGTSTPPGDGPDASTGEGGVRVTFRVEDVDDALFSVGEIRVDADVGEDERLRDGTWRVIEPLVPERAEVLFPLAPPGTYSRVEVRLVAPPTDAPLPAGFDPPDATVIVRTTEDVPAEASSNHETTWAPTCAGVKLAPGGMLDLVVSIDVEGWFEGDLSDAELDEAAELECGTEEE